VALTATLYRLDLSLSDVDRAVYEELDVRAALHPSETVERLALRLLAYALYYEAGIRFSAGGVSAGDEPPLAVRDPNGRIASWIEVGNAPLERLRRAARLSERVTLLTTREVAPLRAEAAASPSNADARVGLDYVAPSFIAALGSSIATAPRGGHWQLTRADGSLYVDAGGTAHNTPLSRSSLASG
jgi:uncharacterized protein YaeQ